MLRNLCFNGWHPLLPWISFLLLGMALARWRIADTHKTRLALVMAPVVYIAAALTSASLSVVDERTPFEQIAVPGSRSRRAGIRKSRFAASDLAIARHRSVAGGCAA